jgi:hypothetical protein
MVERNEDLYTQFDVNASTGMNESGETPQSQPPQVQGDSQPKKKSADWTLPPHLRETLPLNPKGGRAPKPPMGA